MDNALSCGRQTTRVESANSKKVQSDEVESATSKSATVSLRQRKQHSVWWALLKHPLKQKLLVSQAIPIMMGDSAELRTFQKWMLHSILCHLQVTYEILRLCIIQWYDRCMDILEDINLHKSIAIRTSRSQYDHLWCSWKKSGKTGRLTYSQAHIWHWLGPASTITTTWNIQQ